MKYNLKTAVHVTDEFTRQNLIEFFEAIKSDCNKRAWKERDIEIGEYWYLTKAGLLNYRDSLDEYDFTDYTILNGVPQDWREEMTTEERMADKMLEMSREGIDLQSKIDQLESENKELRECIKTFVSIVESYDTDNMAIKGTTWGDTSLDAVAAQEGFNDAMRLFQKQITQAKQLLTK